jgi:hypothetical protein
VVRPSFQPYLGRRLDGLLRVVSAQRAAHVHATHLTPRKTHWPRSDVDTSNPDAGDALLEEGDCLALDLAQRPVGPGLNDDEDRGELDSLRMVRGAGTRVWVCLEDLTLFLTSWGRWKSMLPQPILDRAQSKTFECHGSSVTRLALPVDAMDAMVAVLPWSAHLRLRDNYAWLKTQIHAQLEVVDLTNAQKPIQVSERREQLWIESGPGEEMDIRVKILAGQQPLLSIKDLFAWIEQDESPASVVALCEGVLRPLTQCTLFGSKGQVEPALPGDRVDWLVDTVLRAQDLAADSKRAVALASIRTTSRWRTLRQAVEDLAGADAVPTAPIASARVGAKATKAVAAEEANQQNHNEPLKSTQLQQRPSHKQQQQQQQQQQSGAGYRKVVWEQLQPPQRKLEFAEWTPESEALLRGAVKKKGGGASASGGAHLDRGKKVLAGAFEFAKNGNTEVVPRHMRDMVSAVDVREVLSGRLRPGSSVGIGEITSPNHSCRQAATANGYTGPVYLAFAKRELKQGAVLGEYCGEVVTGTSAEEEEEKADEAADYTASSCVRGEVFSKYRYETTQSPRWKDVGRFFAPFLYAHSANLLNLRHCAHSASANIHTWLA